MSGGTQMALGLAEQHSVVPGGNQPAAGNKIVSPLTMEVQVKRREVGHWQRYARSERPLQNEGPHVMDPTAMRGRLRPSERRVSPDWV